MAERLTYITKPAPMPTARDELEELIQTLSDSGTLRTLNGFFGRFAQVNDVALEYLNTQSGRRLVGSLALLGEVFSKLPAKKLESVATGIDAGIDDAAEALRKDPPSTLHVLRLARDPEVRRAMTALFLILKSVGHELSEEERERSGNGGE